MQKHKTHFLVTAALIAALYAGLTYLGGFFSLSYGAVQFRVSEVLTVLPVFTPAAIPGLTVGCFLANLLSYNPLDMIFGTAATFLAAILTYLLRKFCLRGIPFLSLLSPVIFNALIVGGEIAVFWTKGNASALGFFGAVCSIAVSETVVCLALGIPFFFILRRYARQFFGEY